MSPTTVRPQTTKSYTLLSRSRAQVLGLGLRYLGIVTNDSEAANYKIVHIAVQVRGRKGEGKRKRGGRGFRVRKEVGGRGK